MPFVKSPFSDDRDLLIRSEFSVRTVSVKAGEWVEVPEADAKSLEEQGWELRKTDPGKSKGGS